jgi:hypothetical protein
LAESVFRAGAIARVVTLIDSQGLTGEAELHVFALFGGILIQVPPHWTVLLYGTPVLGGFEEKTVVPPDAGKRLIVRGYAIMGSVPTAGSGYQIRAVMQ